MILCPCCQRQYDVLSNYLIHNCDCRFNPCKMMDFMEGPPPKRPRLDPSETSSSTWSSCTSCSNCSLCVEALKNQESPQSVHPSAPLQSPSVEVRLFQSPQPLSSPIVQPELVILSSQSTIDLSSDDEEGPLDLSRPSVIHYAPPSISKPSHCNVSVQTSLIPVVSQENDSVQLPSIEAESDLEPSVQLEENQHPSLEQAQQSIIQVGAGLPVQLSCEKCGKTYKRLKYLENHMKVCGLSITFSRVEDAPGESGSFKLINSAFKKYLLLYRSEQLDSTEIIDIMTSKFEEIKSLLNTLIDEFGAIKFSIGFVIEFINHIEGKTDKGGFISDLVPCLAASDKQSIFNDALEHIQDRIDQYTQRGSGWTINRVLSIDISAGKYKPYRGGCASCKLPREIINKKCLISPQTETDCFMFAVLIGLHKASYHAERISQYTKYIDQYDFSDVRGIVPIDSVNKFEKKNNVSINVYTCYPDSKAVVPLKICDQEKEKHIDLFLYQQHYYTISCFNRLISNNNKCIRYFCKRCFSSFIDANKLSYHMEGCQQVKAQRLLLPDQQNSILKRKDFRKEVQYPVCIYADFETLNKKTSDMSQISDLEPCSYGYVVVD